MSALVPSAGSALVGGLLALAVLLWPSRDGPLRRRVTGQAADGPAGRSEVDANRGSNSVRWWWPRVPGGRARSADELAAHAEVLAMALRAGAAPSAAEHLATSLVPQARHTSEGLLARAVELSGDLGTPLLPAVEVCADVARREAATRRRHEAALSGVRTSMWLLTALPLVGPLGLAVVGADIVQTYAGSAVAMASLAVGVLLTGAGWWIGRLIVRRAIRPMRYSS